jgi:hypothetical protein
MFSFSPSMMEFNDQSRHCHAERSEASRGPSRQTLRCAQGDKTVPILMVKLHDRVWIRSLSLENSVICAKWL